MTAYVNIQNDRYICIIDIYTIFIEKECASFCWSTNMLNPVLLATSKCN